MTSAPACILQAAACTFQRWFSDLPALFLGWFSSFCVTISMWLHLQQFADPRVCGMYVWLVSNCTVLPQGNATSMLLRGDCTLLLRNWIVLYAILGTVLRNTSRNHAIMLLGRAYVQPSVQYSSSPYAPTCGEPTHQAMPP
jgi:hypothetical protein